VGVVADTGGEVDGRGDPDGAVPDVRANRDVLRTGHVGDTSRLRETATPSEVGLDHVDQPLVDQALELEPPVVGLSGRQRDVDAPREFAVPRVVLRRHRFLDPGHVVLFDGPGGPERLVRSVVAVDVDHQAPVVAENLPRRPDPFDVLVRTAADLDLHRGEPLVDGPSHGFGGGPLGLGEVHRRRVRSYRLAARAAQQSVDRSSGDFPPDVPAGDVDRTDDALDERAPAEVVRVGVRAVGQGSRVERVHADDVVTEQLVDRGPNDRSRSKCLAPSDHAVSRFYPNSALHVGWLTYTSE